MAAMRVHKLNGMPVDVDLARARNVAELRTLVAVALGVDSQPSVGIKLLNGVYDVSNDTSLESLNNDAGLCVVLVQGAPEWYPRDKYLHNDKEVLQMTRESGTEYAMEFVDGSSETTDATAFEKARGEWAWTEVSVGSRVWLHPPEKPKESEGWTSFLTSPTVRKGAVTGLGVCGGFLAGVTGHLEGPDDDSDFSTSFRVAQVVGVVIYVGYQISKIASIFRK